MMARNDIEMKITADSRGVAAGLKPMMTSLDQAQAAAEETEAALDSIGTAPVRVNINDEAVERARAEIRRLRDEMREQLRADVTANTKDAERRIKELQRSIRILDAEDPVVNVDVVVETTRLDHVARTITDVRDLVGGGGTGLIGGLSSAARGFGGVGGAAATAAGPVTIAGAAMVGASIGAWKLGEQAAFAESQVAQLDALTQGMGEETFGELQKWAAATPFAIDDATNATKRLVAAGVELEDIPDTLGDLGEVAAATGVPLEQIATVFSQMVSKGKASYEELQQLAEAGIPVWQTLADRLGLSVAEVQKLATEGKLGADAIDLLRESLADTYSGSMQRQAETFNGRMSTLKDNIDQVGQNVGAVFLPAMKDILAVLELGLDPLLQWSVQLKDLNATMEETSGIGLLDVFSPFAAGLDLINGGMKDNEDQAKETGDAMEGSFVTDAIKKVQDQLKDNKAEIEANEDAARDLAQAFEDAVDAFEGIGANVRARVDFIISEDDLDDELRKITEGSKDAKPVQLPAELKVGQIGGLTDAQQDLVGLLSDRVQLGIEEGARLAQIDPTFDARQFYTDLRKELRPLIIDAGIDPKQVDRFLDDVLGVPAPWKVEPELTGVTVAQQNMLAAFPDVTVPIIPEIPPKGREALEASMGIALGAGEDGLAAVINTEVAGADESRRLLDEVALPEGQDRTAWIDVKLRRSGDILSLPDAVGSVLGSSDERRPGAGPGVGPTERREPQRAPRVQVLIDGEEVATHLRRRGRQVSTAGGRRNP